MPMVGGRPLLLSAWNEGHRHVSLLSSELGGSITGIGGLFRGYWVACLRDAPFAGLYFTVSLFSSGH